MSTKLVAAVLATAAVTVSSVAAARPVAAKQQVFITVKGEAHSFVLTPTGPGPVARDSGTVADCCWSQRFVVRDGQRIEINDPLETLTGKRGSFAIRYRIEWVDAGNGYTVGTGTWKVVRGTGAYKHVAGGGRSAHAWLPRGFVSGRADGYLHTR
jgi:hypothetical protein